MLLLHLFAAGAAILLLLLVLLLVYVCSSNSVELTKVGVMLHIYCEKERGEDNVK